VAKPLSANYLCLSNVWSNRYTKLPSDLSNWLIELPKC